MKLSSHTALALALLTLAGSVAAQQNNNRTVINRRPAIQGQINNAALANAAVYGPGVIDVERGFAAGGNRIQPDWDAARLIAPTAIARFMQPQQQQQFMSANGLSPIGNTGFASVAQKYTGPAGSIGISANCANTVYSDWNSGKPIVSLLTKACGFSGLIVTYAPVAAGGGALLDCAFKSQQVTALRAQVLGRDEATKGFSIVLGETVQSFPAGTDGSLPIAIKKKPGTAPPMSIKIDVPESGGYGLIDLHGCTVTPLG